MTEHVKYLPAAAIPEGGVTAWTVAEGERWLKARVPPSSPRWRARGSSPPWSSSPGC
ncbi:hypothetical protein [Streptomyces sp. NPDC046712]|uniref:hypothetical protein n=1 Tax=Streptomyces sp. NPDC046712 TaxID=3154802 RepID=UPI0033D46747